MRKKHVFTTLDGKNRFTRSRWLRVKTNYAPGPRNALWDHVTDGAGFHPYQQSYNPAGNGGPYLDYFTYQGRNYAVDQFIALGSIWIGGAPYEIHDTDGKSTFISAVDMDGPIYGPALYLEIDEYGEHVRVYEEANKNDY